MRNKPSKLKFKRVVKTTIPEVDIDFKYIVQMFFLCIINLYVASLGSYFNFYVAAFAMGLPSFIYFMEKRPKKEILWEEV